MAVLTPRLADKGEGVFHGKRFAGWVELGSNRLLAQELQIQTRAVIADLDEGIGFVFIGFEPHHPLFGLLEAGTYVGGFRYRGRRRCAVGD